MSTIPLLGLRSAGAGLPRPGCPTRQLLDVLADQWVLGADLAPVLGVIKTWAEAHMDDVAAARAAADAVDPRN